MILLHITYPYIKFFIRRIIYVDSSTYNLHTLYIKFFIGWFNEVEEGHSRSLHIKLFYSITYMSRILLHTCHVKKSFVLWKIISITNYGVKCMIRLIIELSLKIWLKPVIIGDKYNNGRQRLDMSVHMILFVSDIVKLLWMMAKDESDCVICLEELGKYEEREKHQSAWTLYYNLATKWAFLSCLSLWSSSYVTIIVDFYLFILKP